MKLTLYPHGGSGNHGCEAIVRSTALITGADLELFSARPHEDHRYGLDYVCHVHQEQRVTNRRSPAFWKSYLFHKMGDRDALDAFSYSPIVDEARRSDYALSIGGDNYCYGAPRHIYFVNRMLRRHGVKTILWGCSVEPGTIDDEMLEDLRGYSHIIARESITHNALLAHGINHVSLAPDPAFLLRREELPLPRGFIADKTVGINVSPMIVSHESQSGITMANYINLIEHIITRTGLNVALIPHVVWENNDDRKPLRELHTHFASSGRVAMIDDHNAEQLKGFIARCRLMVAARTHASIAAYSSLVPTLVVGYSIKARGIATDIFSTEENYVIPVQALDHSGCLTEAFKWLAHHEQPIRDHLTTVMPQYREKARLARDILNTLTS